MRQEWQDYPSESAEKRNPSEADGKSNFLEKQKILILPIES